MSSDGYTALVVDDEPQVRELTARSLAREGFRCEAAADGDEALRKFAAGPFDVVVTDLRMPNRHGHALCGELLKRPKPPKIMVVSGLADGRLVRDLIARGVDDVVCKPIPYDVLAVKVLALLERKRWQALAATQSPGATISMLERVERSLLELTDLFDDRLDGVFVDAERCEEPPRAVAEFVKRLRDIETADELAKQVDPELRSAAREPFFGVAVAVPVTAKFKRVDEPFKLAVRDISMSGARLLHTRATQAEFLALKWRTTRVAGRDIRVVLKVLRCQVASPFYDIGGQFVLAD